MHRLERGAFYGSKIYSLSADLDYTAYGSNVMPPRLSPSHRIRGAGQDRSEATSLGEQLAGWMDATLWKLQMHYRARYIKPPSRHRCYVYPQRTSLQSPIPVLKY